MADQFATASIDENHNQNHNDNGHDTHKDSHDHDTHDSHGHDDNQGGNDATAIFNDLLNNVGDHKDFYIGPYKTFELPYIFIDDGFHFYWNAEQVEQSGLYEFHGHHHDVIRKDTGDSPQWDLSITNLVVFQWISIIILLVMFISAGSKYKKNKNKAPKGFQNFMETLVTFVRDDIVKANIPNDKAVKFLLPYFIALFLFILTCNLLGLLPGGHTATGSFLTTGALALISLFVINLTAIFVVGPGAWLHHLTGGTPVYMWIIMVPVEILGLFVKPFALMVRLFATMTAGHVILYSLLGILFLFGLWLFPAITGFSVFIYGLELIVAMLQAYLFTILTAVFTGLQLEHDH